MLRVVIAMLRATEMDCNRLLMYDFMTKQDTSLLGIVGQGFPREGNSVKRQRRGLYGQV